MGRRLTKACERVNPQLRTRGVLLLAAVLFCVGATANSGGYRYGASDQAFYTVAVIKKMHPDFFPRDTALIEAESRLMISDTVIARLAQGLGVDLPPLYFLLYVATLFVLFYAAVS